MARAKAPTQLTSGVSGQQQRGHQDGRVSAAPGGQPEGQQHQRHQRQSGVVRAFAILGQHLDPPGKLHDAAVLLHGGEESVGGREEGIRQRGGQRPAAAAGEVQREDERGHRAEAGHGRDDDAVEEGQRDVRQKVRQERGEVGKRGHIEEARGDAAVLERVPSPGVGMRGNEAGDGNVTGFDGAAEGQLAGHEERRVEAHVEQEDGQRQQGRGQAFHRRHLRTSTPAARPPAPLRIQSKLNTRRIVISVPPS